jgi:hypothetical protein
MSFKGADLSMHLKDFLQRRMIIGLIIFLAAGPSMGRSQTHPGTQSAPGVLSWTEVDSGLSYAVAENSSGRDVFVGFGGWNVQQNWVNSWVASLSLAKLQSLGIRHMYAVRGPRQVDYADREIGTFTLARQLVGLAKSDTACRRIIIAAHSSGSYVAHALLEDLYGPRGIDSGGVTFGMIVYFDLDGGIGNGFGVLITQAMVDRMSKVYGVYAYDAGSALYSPNRSDMVDLGAMFGNKSASLEIFTRGYVCEDAWCVHMTLINQKPHDPRKPDAAADYGNIDASHPVTVEYLNVLRNLH